MSDSVELPVFTATLTHPECRADNPANVDLIGSPVTVTVPTRDGGTNTATGIILRIGDGYMTVQFIA